MLSKDWRDIATEGVGLEIAPCVKDGPRDYTRTSDADKADVWSVYVITTGGPVVWIADAREKSGAEHMAEIALEAFPNLAKRGVRYYQ